MWLMVLVIVINSVIPTIPDTVYMKITQPEFYSRQKCQEMLTDFDKELSTWFSQNQTAHLMSNGVTIGFAGIMNSAMLSKVTQGNAFVFELNGDALLAHKPSIKKYQHISKFPGVHRDVSMLVPLVVTVDQVVAAIASADRRIHSISLIDFFQKDEWKESKSLTIRFTIQDQEKTLTGEQADFVYAGIVKKLKKVGATIR